MERITRRRGCPTVIPRTAETLAVWLLGLAALFEPAIALSALTADGGDTSCAYASLQPTNAVPYNEVDEHFLLQPGSKLPLVREFRVGGFGKLGETYAGLARITSVFSPIENETTPAGLFCLYPKTWSIEKVDKLGDLHMNISNETPIDAKFGMYFPNNVTAESFDRLLSRGLFELSMDLTPGVVRPVAILTSKKWCKDCRVELVGLNYTTPTYPPGTDWLERWINVAWRIEMEFLPAFIDLAGRVLALLEAGGTRLEQLKVHGGERWGDPGQLLPLLPRLRTLDFSWNGLTLLRPENLENAPALQELRLAHNQLAAVPAGLRAVPELRTLDLSANPLDPGGLPAALRTLSHLRSLSLSHVLLPGLEPLSPADGAALAPELDDLDLCFCGLHDLSSAAARRFFVQHPHLRSLRLSGNLLGEPGALPPALFLALPQLRMLNLTAAGLLNPPGLRFSGPLDQLLLAANNLTEPGGALAAGGAVRLLDLSGNPLENWRDEGAFRGVRQLNLSSACLSMLDATELNSLAGLDWLDLGNNPINCEECGLDRLQAWLQDPGQRNGTEVRVLGNQVPMFCMYPAMKRGLLLADAPPPKNCPPPGSSLSPAAVAGAVVGSVAAAVALLVLLACGFRLEITYLAHLLRVRRFVADRSAAQSCEFDAFVCYSKSDRSWVLGELLPRLEGAGVGPHYRLCLHERDFALGSYILDNIADCMHRSRHTLIVLTRAFVSSQWCQWELEMAAHRLLDGAPDFLILLELERLEARAVPRLLRLLLDTRTFLEWPAGSAARSAKEAAWRRLRTALGPPLLSAAAAASIALPAPGDPDCKPGNTVGYSALEFGQVSLAAIESRT